MTFHRPLPQRPQPTLHPRKVRAGVRLSTKEGPVSTAWSAQRWMRLVEEFAAGEQLAEGLVYARLGQTRTFEVRPGHIAASVQGRMPLAYTVNIRLPVFTPEQWDQVVDAMTHEARFLASLLGGEVPPNIEDLFSPIRLRLFPQERQDLAVNCTCAEPSRESGGWCKHICCAMAILAERLGKDTFLIFEVRGLGREDLLERLRQRRAVVSSVRAGVAGERLVPAYSPRLPGGGGSSGGPGESAPSTLDQSIEHFWNAPPGVEPPDLTPVPPEVSHPLLRRLGPSPFIGAKFPLVGLLATCYDVIGAAAIDEPIASGEAEPENASQTPDRVESPESA